jgi:hypothetical protein
MLPKYITFLLLIISLISLAPFGSCNIGDPVITNNIIRFGTVVGRDQYVVYAKSLDPDMKIDIINSLFIGCICHHDNSTVFDLEVAYLNELLKKGPSDNSLISFECDGSVHTNSTTQLDSPWHLDRIDQVRLPLDGEYTHPNNQNNVNVYIVDTGIKTSHDEFEGRAKAAYSTLGLSFPSGDDCNGHGTHVSAIIGGKTVGINKNVTLHDIRVLNCFGYGTWGDVILALEWVKANHTKPAIINMSLSGFLNTLVNTAIKSLQDAGVMVVVAAGNNNNDACEYSPASSEAITVGASTSSDSRASYSNYGECVNIYAPGDQVTSAGVENDQALRELSGTSMASPVVAGIASVLLSENTTLSISALRARILNRALTVINTNIKPLAQLYDLPKKDCCDILTEKLNQLNNTLVTKVSEFTTQINQLVTDDSELHSKLNELNSTLLDQIGTLSDEVQVIDNMLTQTNSTLDMLHGELERVNSELERLANLIESLNTTICNKINVLQIEIDLLKLADIQLNERITSLNETFLTQVNLMKSEVARLDGTDSTLLTKINLLDGVMQTQILTFYNILLEANLTLHSEKQKAYEMFNALNATLCNKIDILQTEIDLLMTRDIQLGERITDLNETLIAQVNFMKSEVTRLDGTDSTLLTKINVLDGAMQTQIQTFYNILVEANMTLHSEKQRFETLLNSLNDTLHTSLFLLHSELNQLETDLVELNETHYKDVQNLHGKMNDLNTTLISEVQLMKSEVLRLDGVDSVVLGKITLLDTTMQGQILTFYNILKEANITLHEEKQRVDAFLNSLNDTLHTNIDLLNDEITQLKLKDINLQSDVNTLNDTHQGDVLGLRNENVKLGSDIDTLNSTHQEDILALRNENVKLESDVDTLNNTHHHDVLELRNEDETIWKVIHALNNTGCEFDADAIYSRMDSLNYTHLQDILGLRVDVTALKIQDLELLNDTSNNKIDITLLNSNIGTVDGKVTALAAQLVTVQNDVLSLKTGDSALHERIDDLNLTMNSILLEQLHMRKELDIIHDFIPELQLLNLTLTTIINTKLTEIINMERDLELKISNENTRVTELSKSNIALIVLIVIALCVLALFICAFVTTICVVIIKNIRKGNEIDT